MRDYVLLVSYFLLFPMWCLYYVAALQKGLHMFQQNRYEIRRFWPWFLHNHPIKLPISISIIIVVLSLALLFAPGIEPYVVFAWVINFGYSGIRELQGLSQSKQIKPLNVTARVKRQIVVLSVLMLGLLAVLSQLPWFLILLISIVLKPLIPLVIILMAFITWPIEATFRKFYQNEARAQLLAHQQLIKVGITGSYGKTSSKVILAEMLSQKYYVLASPASFNTPMGLTITIREQLKALHQVFIAEMGADKKGEIEHLSRFIKPKYGILTSIGPQHLNTFKTLENIIHEKFRLIENLPNDGVAVLNYDYALIREYPLKNTFKVVSYGIDYPADIQATNILYTPSGSSFDVSINGHVVSFQTRLLGKHNISNILAGIALGHHLGLDVQSLQKAVKGVNYVEHRLQLKKINGLNYIDNAYNSNPVGSMMALDVLSMMPNRRFIVTPGMIELGDEEAFHNTNFGTYMKGRADVVVLVGPIQTQPIYKGLQESGFDMNQVYVVNRVREAFALVESLADEQDIILLENDLPDAFNR